MQAQANAVQEVTVKSVFKTMLHATMAIMSLAPRTVTLVDTNLDTLQRVSNAGNKLGQMAETSVDNQYEIYVMEMAQTKALLKRQYAAELKS